MQQQVDQDILRQVFNAGARPFRDWDEFSTYVNRAYPVLIETARRGDLVSYSELGARIGLPINEWFQTKIATIVGTCSCYEHDKGRPLLSSIVVNKETRTPGEGYWDLPGIPRLRKVAARHLDESRQELWVNEVRKVFEYWKTR